MPRATEIGYHRRDAVATMVWFECRKQPCEQHRDEDQIAPMRVISALADSGSAMAWHRRIRIPVPGLVIPTSRHGGRTQTPQAISLDRI